MKRKIIARILAKSEFWQQFSGVAMSDRQRKVVNRLLDAGPGGLEGGLTKNEGLGRNISYDLNQGSDFS